MQPSTLERFLAKVRKPRFVDYLDPLGETATSAFERRLRWARRNLKDKVCGDEASFLVEHEQILRTLIQEEIRREEEAAQGLAHENQVTEEADAPPVPPAFRKTPSPAEDRFYIPTPLRTAVDSPLPQPAISLASTAATEADLERTGIIRSEDLTPMPFRRPQLDPVDVATAPMVMPRAVSPMDLPTDPEQQSIDDAVHGELFGAGQGLFTEADHRILAKGIPTEPSKMAPYFVTTNHFRLTLAVCLVAMIGGLAWLLTRPSPSTPEISLATPPQPLISAPKQDLVDVGSPPETVPPIQLPSETTTSTPPAPASTPPAPASTPPAPASTPPQAIQAISPGSTPAPGQTPVVLPPAPTTPLVTQTLPVPEAVVANSPQTVTQPPTAPLDPPRKSEINGFWQGKVGNAPVYLTVKSAQGSAIHAQAELQSGDTFIRMELRGTYNAETGSLNLVDPYSGGQFDATVADGKLIGSATPEGQPQQTWTAYRH